MWVVNQTDDEPKTKLAADARAARLAAALKSNLRRRKAQARERAGADRADTPANDNAEPSSIAGRNEE